MEMWEITKKRTTGFDVLKLKSILFEDRGDDYDAIVVGSGYGGSVAACWLVLKSAYLSMFYIIILHLKYQKLLN